MNLNFKVRYNNPYFWFQIFLAIVAPISAYYGIQAKDITTWSMVGHLTIQIFMNPFVLFTIGVSVFNALIDPTTNGFADSRQAMNYKVPKKD
ncbi:holin [Staphylococcus lentus]|uniref:phage holin n=1 Tax=Mammaliicoccus lentus TaxID=42858 RepID=UPI0018845F17|nr:phage holin [Mammaliicoccus lentus]MBF0842297.1 holin [Mammaliicoccus lentus]